ncbi:hypothetical protein [Bacteroides eggerthii]|uniref:hypothetical protein n=1 Tax=Bacteroides eggerthii TaxID=28111 RepID=UPI001FE94A12|nr:hypothetical protein [Bacteroides eggerthii]
MILLKFPVRLQTELSGVRKVLPSFWANKESVNNIPMQKLIPLGILLCFVVTKI